MKHLSIYTKYIKYYNIIILKSKLQNRKRLKKSNPDYTYYENHHILPKSIFPEYKNLRTNKWNSVLLTAREHFICHILLWKHYKSIKYTDGEIKMSMALKRLAYDGKHNSRKYESLKINIKFTDEHKKNIGLSSKGRINTRKGIYNYSSKTWQNKFKRLRKKYNIKYINQNNNIKIIKFYIYTPEDRLKNSLSRKGNTLANDTKRKISNSNKGIKNHFYGKHHTYEQKEKWKIDRKNTQNESKNHNAKQINIYDDKDNLIYECYGTFAKVCKEYNLPMNAFHNSYKNKGSRLYNSSKAHPKEVYKKFKNWYALLKHTF